MRINTYYKWSLSKNDPVEYFKETHKDMLGDIKRIMPVDIYFIYIEFNDGSEAICDVQEDIFEDITVHTKMSEENRKKRFCAILKNILKEKRLTQTEVAERINIKREYDSAKNDYTNKKSVHKKLIHNCTKGYIPSNEELLREIAEAVECSFEYMWGLE